MAGRQPVGWCFVGLILVPLSSCGKEVLQLRTDGDRDGGTGAGISPELPDVVTAGGSGGTGGPGFGLPNSPCATDGQCFPPLRCHSTLGRCVECVDHFQCSFPTPYCNAQAGDCVPCLEDQHCTELDPDLRCDTSTHGCRRSCSTSADCASYLFPICNEARGICVTCVSDADCRPGDSCYEPFGACVECFSSDDCEPGRVCNRFGRCFR